MNNIFLEGEKVHLRPLEARDLTARYLSWLNDAEVSRGNGHAVFPQTAKDLEDYYKSVKRSRSSVVLAVVDKRKRLHIGNVSLQRIHWVHRNAEFAILIGDKRYWKGGFGTEAMRLLLAYGFERLNLHRVHCGTFEGNEGMKRLALTLGMRKEGRRREAVFKEGRYLDVLEYGILRREFKVKE